MQSVNTSLMKDMIGREVILPKNPKRIICLVPSLSELLSALNLDERVVGISKFCIYPNEWFQNKSKIGGTKHVNLKKVDELQPDLIIANKEENSLDDINQLSEKYPVWVSDINSFDDALHAIEWIGELTQSEKYAKGIIFGIHKAWSTITIKNSEPLSCAYLIWNEPFMAAAKDTFIDSILEKVHLKNVFTESRYPEVSIAIIEEKNPDFLFLSSEPYPFKEKHRASLQEKLPNTKVILVDGEMFSWYGNRMKNAAYYLQKLLSSILNN